MSARTIKSISTADLHRLLQRGAEIELIDVRPREMYDAQRVEKARFVEFSTLDPVAIMANRKAPPGDPLYVICQIGRRSVKACERFIEARYGNVVSVEGGTRAWAKGGFPIVGLKKGFSCPMLTRIRQLIPFKSKNANAG